MTFRTWADKYSLQAFMNSFLRDYVAESFVCLHNNHVDIEFQDQSKARLHFFKRSVLGHHQYQSSIEYFIEGEIKQLDFEHLVQLLSNKLFSPEQAINLKTQVMQSRDLMQAMLEFNAQDQVTCTTNYRWSEQSLLLGHPFHPFPKARTGMDLPSIKAYSPEFKPACKLSWWAVKEELLFSKTSNRHQELAWLLQLFRFDFAQAQSSNILSEGYLPMPIHAWQKHILGQHESIYAHIKSGYIVELGQGANDWYPTSSLRSLYCEGAPHLLKFSISAKLTNSLRHLKLKETMRGVQVAKALQHERMDAFFAQYKQFSVLYEPSFTGILSQLDGDLIESSMVVCRENLSKEAKLESIFLLADLVEVDVVTGSSRLHSLLAQNMSNEDIGMELAIKKWFASFLQNVIEPFLVLAAQHGILLGAHLQNILIECEQGYTKRVIFKDCQGTGFSHMGYEEHLGDVPALKTDNGNILAIEQIEKIFIYYLVINSVFGVINAIAECDSKNEIWLLNEFRNFIYKLSRRNYRDNSVFDFILNSEVLYQKGNFRCSVYNHNETTMLNPVDIYNSLENPVKKFTRPIKSYQKDLVYERYIPSLKSKVSFRVFDLERDLHKFHEWNHKKYVSDFWEMDKSYEELAAYISELKKSPYQLPLIYEVDAKPVGYFELYWAYDDRIAPYCQPELFDRGLHLLIGEEKYLRSRYVLEGILNACHFMFEDEPRTKNVWGEPRADNKSILKIANAMPGWRFVREFDFPHKRAALIQCSREDFYQDLEAWKQ